MRPSQRQALGLVDELCAAPAFHARFRPVLWVRWTGRSHVSEASLDQTYASQMFGFLTKVQDQSNGSQQEPRRRRCFSELL